MMHTGLDRPGLERGFGVCAATVDERNLNLCFSEDASNLKWDLWAFHLRHTEVEEDKFVHGCAKYFESFDSWLDLL